MSSTGSERPIGRGRGKVRVQGQVGGKPSTEYNNNLADSLSTLSVGGTGWGSGNLGAPLATPNSGVEENNDQVIDWEALNSNREENERLRWAHLPEMTKDFYSEHPHVAARSEEEVALFRRANNNIEVSNFNPEDETPAMKPVETFEEAFHKFPGSLATIKKQGFQFPSPIQCQAWPYLMAGHDMIGVAQTGTGELCNICIAS